MTITGELLIGNKTRRGENGTLTALEAATGKALDGVFGGASAADLEEAVNLAWQAFPVYRETALEDRAAFLEKAAENILSIGDLLIERAMAESGLPRARLEGERMRTVNQLRLFAGVVREGAFQDLRFDPADATRTPPKPDLRLRKLGLGPVAVFGASNFPLAFSVAGGDTASALAAGCPVVVKAHPAHLGTSELVARAVQQAVIDCGMPEGTFSMLHDTGYDIGGALVAHPLIRAVGFTGSRRGGLALIDIAAKRDVPIPVYAEMSAINPVLLFPEALKARGREIGTAFAASLTLGAGQFCTNPGLILAVESEGLEAFKAGAVEALKDVPAQTMLTPGISKAYRDGVARLVGNGAVTRLAEGQQGDDFHGQAALFETTAASFLNDKSLHDEVFGSAGLIVRCRDPEELETVIDGLEGQLTIALHIAAGDYPAAGKLMPKLEMLAGRLLVNGFGTGVEVSPAMVHGGPYPATSDARSTSVGTLAIDRFLRPVSYQDMPADLLPKALRGQG
ncbi:aldehyde dehydrogenase (NADP(+)) [Martelella radicis]|uniref:NADP-dependent aldehyde dehydrogenase n=1 Tax=Martelella radicis TaxID=1397476 RepID=A0A7W6P9A2_9HYPH|nr:aldehyde dehydrogenase (NADP(+)) [Martelella radicis]MBB4122062.1 NADP-dependent aldehyde dehydrogenase [Martelella radicis]